MFAYLLAPFFMIIHNGVCRATQPEVVMETTMGSVATWDIDQPVQAMVQGQVVNATFSKTSCVYFEWVIGTTTGLEGSGDWVSYLNPVLGGGELLFQTQDGRTLKINPAGERFRLPVTWSAHYGELPTEEDPSAVREWRTLHQSAPTIREYCLKQGQQVMLTVKEESHWLPPETEGGSPIEDVHRRVHVSVEVPKGPDSSPSDDTPQPGLDSLQGRSPQ
ncbi:MAG: hypothetical protein ACPGTU_14520 [Myxococcota bacterium]